MNEIIKKALERAGMSQKDLAEAIHVTPQAVSKWISGDSRPTQDNVTEIYRVLGVDLTKETVKAFRKGKTAMKRQHCDLRDLDSIAKAKDESRLILEDAGIPHNYSHTIYQLLHWLVTGTIGMVYYRMLLNKEREQDFDYEDIRCDLEEFFEKEYRFKGYPNKLAYNFFIHGGELFEANAEYEMEEKYVDYGNEAMALWYNFERVFEPNWHSPLLDEVKVALLEVIEALE